ncbi:MULTISPECIES: intercompartmental signaling factor BofC [Sutcliffiella]|uniref:intercompartmental signaling factor BofC n=1 Tax=Sutcliffiella TaxID=2837511 RepID=UPI0022DDF407|nr:MULTISPECIES: intercompartmental signaling factor BofC [Sutcliffiella]MED4016383.1 intercompartmental signaling factor BofC [Sutcliffiella cohnii]WBL13964.1 intercompartmental signaling factor BofC [Sutcliffiella sp. NC1]
MKPIIPKQIIIIFSSFFIFCTILYTTLEIKGNAEVNKRNNDQLMEELDEAYEVNGPLKLTVVLERIYVDGEVSEEVLEETIWAMEDFWADYEDWQLVTQDEEQVVFQMHIDDISPLLKSNGYFGITEEGILTIFDGKPDAKSKIIQSFYQIDVEKLESHKHNLLKNGIKVFSKDEYEQVLEAFKAYSAQPH